MYLHKSKMYQRNEDIFLPSSSEPQNLDLFPEDEIVPDNFNATEWARALETDFVAPDFGQFSDVDERGFQAAVRYLRDLPVNDFEELNGENNFNETDEGYSNVMSMKVGELTIQPETSILFNFFHTFDQRFRWNRPNYVLLAVKKLVFTSGRLPVRLGSNHGSLNPHRSWRLNDGEDGPHGRNGSGNRGGDGADGVRGINGNFRHRRWRFPEVKRLDAPKVWLFVESIEVDEADNSNTPFFVFDLTGANGGDGGRGQHGGNGGNGGRGRDAVDGYGCKSGPGPGGDGGNGGNGGNGANGGPGGNGGDINFIGTDATVGNLIRSLIYNTPGTGGASGNAGRPGAGGYGGGGGKLSRFCRQGAKSGDKGRDGTVGVGGEKGPDGKKGEENIRRVANLDFIFGQ